MFGAATPVKAATRVAPDCAWIHSELKRHRHVTLQLLWEEYGAQHGAAAYQRSAFCQIYRDWEKRLKRSMRQRNHGPLAAKWPYKTPRNTIFAANRTAIVFSRLPTCPAISPRISRTKYRHFWHGNQGDPHLLDSIKSAANSRDVPYQSLIKVWLQEKVTRR